MNNKTKLAIFLMILSALSFSLMQMSVKISGKSIPVMQQVFSRNLIIMIISIIVLLKNKESFLPNKESIIPLILRSLFGFLGVVASFYAFNNMILADASILQNTSPFWSTFFAFLIIKEKILKIQWFTLIIAIIGAMFVIKPSFNSNIFPSLVALSGAMFAGLAYTMIGSLKGKERNSIIILYFSLISTAFSLIFAKSFVMPSLHEFFMLILIGVFAGFGQFFLTISYKEAPVSTVSIFNYTGIIFSYLISVLFFNELIDVYSVIGMFLTISAALIVYFYKLKVK